MVPLPANVRTLEGTTALFAYEGPLARALTRLKYHGNPAWAGPLGGLLASAPELRDSPRSGAPWDAIVPVPLHWKRLMTRGFNQSLLLAQAARRAQARRARVPVRPSWLKRVRATPPQAELDAATRRRNLQDAFAAPRPRQVHARRILLVDDVTTTGATLDAAADALRRAGAAEVGGLVLMRTLPST